MWKKKHSQTIKQDCWSLCVGVKEIETYQKLYAFGTCIREGALSFPTSLQWHSIWRIIPLSNTLVTMVIHYLCMITHRMRTCDHLINHLRYMGWATKYRLKSFGTTTPGITRWECHPAPRQTQVQMMRALPPQTQEEVGWDGAQHILGAILKSIPYSKPCGSLGHHRILRRIQTDPFFHSSDSLNPNYVSAPKKVFPTRCTTGNSTWQCNIRHLQMIHDHLSG